MEQWVGQPLELFLQTLSEKEREAYEICYTLGREEHLMAPDRTKRIVMVRGKTIYVSCFRDGMPEGTERTE